MTIRNIRSMFFVIALIISLPIVGQSQEAQNQNNLIEKENSTIEKGWEVLTNEERLVTLAYLKLSTYNRTIGAEDARANKTAYSLQDALEFDIKDLRSGAIEEVYDKPFGQLVTKPAGQIVQIARETITQHTNFDVELEHVAFRAQWANSPYISEEWNSTTLREMLSRDSSRFADVKYYTSYQVTVRLEGVERTYRALALHHGPRQSNARSDVDFLDYIGGGYGLSQALVEDGPPVRSPWEEYVNSSEYHLYKDFVGANGNNSSIQMSSSLAAECPTGTRDDVWKGACYSTVTKRICFPQLKGAEAFCDPLSCDYPQCKSTPTPRETPTTDISPNVGGGECNTVYFNPVTDQSGLFTTDHIRKGHSAWAQMRGQCKYCQEACTVTCSMNWWGVPSYGTYEKGARIFWTFHQVGIQVSSHPSQSSYPAPGSITCGRAVGVAWRGCLFPCGVTVTVGWNGNGFNIGSNGMDQWLFGPTISCQLIEHGQ